MALFTRRRLMTGVGALAALTGFGINRAMPFTYHEGPPSDHFDGVRFHDPNGMPPKNFADQWRWFRENNKAVWPARIENEFADTPPARVDGNAWRIAHIGHATNLLQTAGLNIVTDPVWSERASPFTFLGPKRVSDPGIAFDALPKIDVVLLTHNHYDHFDAATLKRLHARDNPRIITPLGNDTILKSYDSTMRAEAHDWDETADLGNGVAVTLLRARHWSARGLRDQHMNPEEAVKAFHDLGAEHALGHHYGTFQLTDEAIDAPVKALIEARTAANIPPEKFRVLKPGEVWEL